MGEIKEGFLRAYHDNKSILAYRNRILAYRKKILQTRLKEWLKFKSIYGKKLSLSGLLHFISIIRLKEKFSN